MATQTIAAILERVETVLQDPPCLLKPSANPFTETTTPNIDINETYRVQAAGVLSDTDVGNFLSARRERVIVTLYQRMDFDGYQAQRDLQDLLNTVERAIIADGPDHSYMAFLEKGSGKVTRPKDTDLCEAPLSFIVDYDYDQSND